MDQGCAVFLALLDVVNVGARSEPAGDLSLLIAQRFGARQEPAYAPSARR
jgi:hypothetical protein